MEDNGRMDIKVLTQYGDKRCVINLKGHNPSRAYLNAKEIDHPLIAMGYIGTNIFNQKEINILHETNEPCTKTIKKSEFIEILNGLDDTILDTCDEENMFINQLLLHNRYPATHEFDLTFNIAKDDYSELEISIIKRV